MSATLDARTATLMPMQSQREIHRALAEAHRAEAAELVRLAAAPAQVGEHIKAQIMRAAQRLGFTYRRTRTLWYRETKRIDSWELEFLRGFKKRKRRAQPPERLP